MQRFAYLFVVLFFSLGMFSTRSESASYTPLKKGVNAWALFTMPKVKNNSAWEYDYPPYGSYSPSFTVEDFHRVREQGFDFVRIPVDPGPFLSVPDEQWGGLLEFVRSGVKGALKEGLSVILDVHPPVSHPVNNIDNVIAAYSGARPNELAEKYTKLNVLFASMLAGMDPLRTLLEPMNEPALGCSKGASEKVTIVFNEILKAVREKTGVVRVVFDPPCQSSWRFLVNLKPSSVEYKNVVYTFHFYEPFLFTHQGATWSRRNPYLANVKEFPYPYSDSGAERSKELTMAGIDRLRSVGGEKEKAISAFSSALKDASLKRSDKVIDVAFSAVSQWAKENSISSDQILLGEFGVMRSSEQSGPKPEDRARWLEAVRVAAESRGIGWAVWEYVDVMGVVKSKDDKTLIPSVQKALGLTPGK